MPESWLAALELTLVEDVDDSLAVAVVVLASVAGAHVPLDEDDRRGAVRRALLLLTAGGDPSRGLDLDGRAVRALASDLDEPARREALGAALVELSAEAEGLPHVSEALHGLTDAPDVAWRAYACSLLARELGEED
ncbi:MAG: hypothetical protein E6G42_02420 [Actinobacteria bacterium]|nr:MAG: hypothetical protein E6G42_02420 [Actinomycetota bacterium]